MIETEDNRLGHIKGGAEIEYAPEFYEAKDDMGKVSKVIITEEEATLKSGIMTWCGTTLEKLCQTARVTEDKAKGIRTVKIGGIGNATGKKYLLRFVHKDTQDGNIRVTIVGNNQAGFTIAFAKDSETVIDAEFKAQPMDKEGTLILYTAMNNLKLAGADLGSSILTTLQPTIDKVVNKVKEFTTWFKNLDDNTKQMIVKIGMIVAAIGPALIIFGKMSTGISGVIKTVTGLTSKIGGMSGVLSALTGPVGIVIAIIAALAAGFIALYKTNDEFKEKVDGTIGKVKDAFSQMWTTIQPLLESLKQAFINLMAALKPVFEFVLTYIASIVNGVINAAAPIIAAIQNVIDFVTNIINAIIALLHGDFDGFFSYLQGAFNSAISFVKNIIQAVINFIIGFLEGFGVNVKTLFTNIWNSIVAVFQGVGQWFSDRFTEAWNAITTIFSAIGSWFAARWNDIKTALATVATWFLTMFTNAYTNVTNVFAAIGSWFAARWNDIKTALAAVATWFLTMFTNAYTNVTNVFAAIGSWFGARWTEIKTALASVPTWFKTQFDNAWTNIKNAFANVTSFFSDLWEKIKGCFVNVGVAIGSAVGDAFKSAINSCLSTIEGVVNKFIGMINGVIGIINEIPGVSLSKIDTLSLPRLAKGGVLREGTAMVAEAGPELLSMVNGKAVVTPLTGSAVNTAADNLKGNNSGFRQEINITSPKALSPYEVARQTRIQTRAMVIAMQRG